MKFLKKYKVTIAIVVIFIILVSLAYNVYKLLVPDNSSAVYGDRLDGKDAVIVSEETYANMKTSLEQETFVTSVTSDERGKLINVLVTVADDTSLETAKTLASKMIESFTAEEIAYYDFQIIISKADEEQKSFPIIGYKHAKSDGFSFTKDRVNE